MGHNVSIAHDSNEDDGHWPINTDSYTGLHLSKVNFYSDCNSCPSCSILLWQSCAIDIVVYDGAFSSIISEKYAGGGSCSVKGSGSKAFAVISRSLGCLRLFTRIE